MNSSVFRRARRASVMLPAVLLAALVLAACGGGGGTGGGGGAGTGTGSDGQGLEVTAEITIEDPWARPAPAGDNSAAYFVIHNGADGDDALIGAASDVAHMVEVHQSRMEDGVMKMEHIEELPIPAGQSVTLEPGGYHVMFMGLERDLNVGDKFQLELHFRQAGTVTIDVEVREP
ncbi:MAG: copper chaperone PCu(A)C [Thermaerobacter sp.]